MSAADPRPVVIGLGEFLWDVFPDGREAGGAPTNFAFQAKQLGCQGVLVTRLGADQDGDDLLATLDGKGLDLTNVQRDPVNPTGLVTVELKDGHPSYIIHENVAWDAMEITPELEQTMRSANAVCFGTLAQRHEISRATIHQAVALTPDSCLRVYDVNLRQHYYHADWIRESLKLANIVKLNDEELPILADLLGLPSDPLEFAKTICRDFQINRVCLTRGAKGCLIYSPEEHHDVAGKPVKVADTVGAGDAFTAGFVFAQLSQWPLGLSTEFANGVGGLVASRRGAMPELEREFAQLIEQYRP